MTKTFRDLGVDAALCDALEAKNIIHPFPIQELTLPLALGRNDLIAQARTGTGKTLGFGLPLLQQVDADQAVTQALVVVPTRELCLQVHDDLTIGEARGLTTISVYGGVGFDEQTDALRAGVHVVVGTPGRLLDHLQRGNLDLSKVKVLVLDEADEMLDMGFLPDVERLIEACPAEGRHTMLFSATMPTAIVKMARRYLHHPTFMRADSEEHETAPNVAQHFFSVHRMDKPRVLARILQSPGRGRCYVFVRTKNMADRLVNDLEELGVPAIAIHGDLRQQTREKNLDRFRSGKADVLVATEVAARGIDVTDVTHVVNYDCPDDEKMYLHRIGRTARAGNAGVAVTFAEFNEADRLNVIRKAVGATDTEVHQIFSTSPLLAELFDLPDERPWDHLSKRGGGRDGGGRDGGGDRRSEPRKGRSDGRPKNRREREGSGRDRDGSRDRATRRDRDEASAGRAEGGDTDGGRRPRSDRGGDTGRDRGNDTGRARGDDSGRDRADAAGRRSGGRSDDDGAGATRSRERTRTRAAGTSGGGAATSEPRPRARARADRPGDEAAPETRQRKSGGRNRARSGDDADPQRDRDGGKSGSGRSGGGRGGGGRSGGGSGRNRSGRDRADQRDDRDERDRGGQDAREGRTRGGGRSGDRGRGQGDGDRGRRNERGRGTGGNRRDGQRETTGDVPGMRPARRGADARGEGDPQLARRVKVEHLP